MSRHDLLDEEYARIEPFLPPERSQSKGRPFVSHRKMLNGMVWILSTGSPWRDLAEEFGPWQTVYGRFRRWCREGLWQRICESLLEQIDQQGKLDRGLWFVDGSLSRAHRCAGGAAKVCPADDSGGQESQCSTQPQEPQDHALGRSRGGFTTKFHLVTDQFGLPLAVILSGGQCNENTQFERLMEAVPGVYFDGTIHHEQPDALGGDKGYSSDAIRAWLDAHGIENVIATRKTESRDESFDKQKYRSRNIIERVIGWLKERRRIFTRFEKLANHYLAMIQIEIARRLMRI